MSGVRWKDGANSVVSQSVVFGTGCSADDFLFIALTVSSRKVLVLKCTKQQQRQQKNQQLWVRLGHGI